MQVTASICLRFHASMNIPAIGPKIIGGIAPITIDIAVKNGDPVISKVTQPSITDTDHIAATWHECANQTSLKFIYWKECNARIRREIDELLTVFEPSDLFRCVVCFCDRSWASGIYDTLCFHGYYISLYQSLGISLRLRK